PCLAGRAQPALSKLPTTANHAIWSRYMSTPFSITDSLRLVRHRPTAERHQSSSWLGWATLLNEWLRWSEQSRQRGGLRDLADDQQLLNELRLKRQEALDEANWPFWE